MALWHYGFIAKTPQCQSATTPIHTMLQHYFKLAYRNIQRDKSTFFINLIGLSTGLACALMIALWVNDEWQIDGFHEKEDRLYPVSYTQLTLPTKA